MEALEELLAGYGGTLLFVSHDETFIRKVATRIVRFENGKLAAFEGGAEEREARREAKPEQQDLKLAVMTLEMRLADLSARMAKPKKGDHPEELNKEYLDLAEKLKEMKRQL